MKTKFNEFINEELNPRIYRKAANIARERKHFKKEDRFREHASDLEVKQNEKWGKFDFNPVKGVYKTGSWRDKNVKKHPIDIDIPSSYFWTLDPGMLADQIGEGELEGKTLLAPCLFRTDDKKSFVPFGLSFNFKENKAYVEEFGELILEIDGKDCYYEGKALFSNRNSANRFKRLLSESETLREEFITMLKDVEDEIKDNLDMDTEQMYDEMVKMIRQIPLDELYKD